MKFLQFDIKSTDEKVCDEVLNEILNNNFVLILS